MRISKYRRRRKNSLSERTLDSRIYILKNLDNFLNGMGKDEPSTDAVHEYIDYLQDEDYNPGTIQQYWYHIRDYCSVMTVDIDEDSVSRRLPSYTPERKEILTKEKVKMIIQEHEYKYEIRTISFLLYTFARRLDEVRTMKLDDVDLDDRSIRFKILKSNLGYKSFDTEPHVYQRMMNWIKKYRDDKNDYLFPGTESEIIGKSTVSVGFRNICKFHGIEPKSTHYMRHSRISHLKSDGVPFYVIRDNLSFHQSLSVLQDTYTHATEEDRESIPALSDSLGL